MAATAAAACGGTDVPIQRVIPSRALPRPLPPYNKNPVYHRKPPAAPIHLSGAVLLRSGTTDAPPISSFQNPMGQDMEILEIKFEVISTYDHPNVYPASFGGSVQCELVLGAEKITNGAIPLWSFGRAENIATEALGTGATSNQVNPLNFYSMFSWRLPRPLFIPAGAVLRPSLTHTGLVPNALKVRVGYSGRTVYTQPKKVCVPYVSSFITTFNPITASATASSNPLQLVNANLEPLHLQRMVGRSLFLADIPDSDNPSIAENYPQVALSEKLNMRITDSYGRPVLRNYVPWTAVINSATRSWEMDNGAIMDPGAFYRVDMRFSAVTTLGPQADGSLQTFLSLVGWREVQP